MANASDHSEGQESEAPDSLVGDLQRNYRVDVEVPEAVDRAILGQARRRFVRRSRLRLILRWSPVAAAAAITALVWVGRPLSERESVSKLMVGGAHPTQDVDQNGRVDILDAFALARLIRERRPAEELTGWDLNGDGVVDRLDVDRVAEAAVRLAGLRNADFGLRPSPSSGRPVFDPAFGSEAQARREAQTRREPVEGRDGKS